MDKKTEKNGMEAYRSERKARLAKAAQKKAKKSRIDTYAIAKVISILICVAVVVAAAVGICFAYGIPQRLLPAVTVGERTYSVAEYEYFYTTVYNNYAQQSSEAAGSYGPGLLSALGYFDYTKHPEQQTKTEDDGTKQTWAAFFDNYVVEMLQSYDYYYAQCKELGITLEEEDNEEIAEAINTVQGYADTNNSSLTRYLSYFYGKGMTAKLYKEILVEQKLAEKYLEAVDKENAASVSDEAIEAAYAETPTDYQVVDLRVFGFATDGSSVTAGEETGTETPATETPATDALPQSAAANEGKLVEIAAVAEESTPEAPPTEEENVLLAAPAEDTAASEEAPSDETVETEAPADGEPGEETPAEEPTVAEESEEVKAILARAEEYANAITDEQSFIDLALVYCDPADAETFKNPSATTANQITKSIVASNISKELSEWLFDGTRASGDKRFIKSDKGDFIYVIYVVNAPYREDDPKVDARHILVSYETGINYINSLAAEAAAEEATADGENAAEPPAEDGAATQTDIDDAVSQAGELFGLTFDYPLAAQADERFTEAVVNATYTAAYDIYKLYMENPVEENFADIANQYSADTSSTTAGTDPETGEETEPKGGLYEDVAKGSMVANFEKWIYDDSRTAGDVSIIQTEYGFHIMYFVAANEKADWQTTVIEKLTASAEEAFTAKIDEIVADKSNVKISFGKNYAYKQAIKLIEELYEGTYFNVDEDDHDDHEGHDH